MNVLIYILICFYILIGPGILFSLWRMEMIFRKILEELKQHSLREQSERRV